MKSNKHHDPNENSVWGPIIIIAKCFNCGVKSMHNWGKAERFGYKRVGPRLYLVNVPEAVDYYTKRFPDIEINLEVLAPYMQPTA